MAEHPDALQGGVLCVVGARPNFMKIAPIMAAFAESGIPARLLHTGQHYDEAMNQRFFADLGIPEPDINLEVGSGSHAQQTAEIMRRFEPVLDALRPRAVLVVGDVNSTIACALVAAKKGVAVIHVEAGLRSFDRSMPEEINRVLTDQLSDLLYTTERSAATNLAREGIDPSHIHFVGNVMIDTLRHNLPRAVPVAVTLATAGVTDSLAPGGYGVLTLHRPSNVDHAPTLTRLLATMKEIALQLPLLFPLHPRTRARIREFGLEKLISDSRIHLLPPQGYLEMLGLMRDARLVLTDSGGIQEETTALGVPCLTLRENTERPITVEEGTNTLVGSSREAILATVADILATGGKAGRLPEYWDGQAARRIAAHLSGWLKLPCARTKAA
ncbi:non-hydrolyzing UDP-N-acetylglucosamine 2-epimerase [Thiobacter aerophilum]|uniref:UDP-N-acetylglucosamine 2-epimerase (Non-hydrolyzing) n=1 Tax=Thiobacter aerophilum TaxID=3121275 RepID=A0ABV0EH50_9BURK